MNGQGVILISRSEEAFRERMALSEERIRGFGMEEGPAKAYFAALKREDAGGMLLAAEDFSCKLPAMLKAFAREYAALPLFREEERAEDCCILMETAIQLNGALCGAPSGEEAEASAREILYSYLFDYAPLFFEEASDVLEKAGPDPSGGISGPFPERRLLLRFLLSLLTGKGVPAAGPSGIFHPEDLALFFGSRMAARILESAGVLLERNAAALSVKSRLSAYTKQEREPDPAALAAFTPGQRKKAAELYGRLVSLYGPFETEVFS